jgi:hypothetical protein
MHQSQLAAALVPYLEATDVVEDVEQGFTGRAEGDEKVEGLVGAGAGERKRHDCGPWRVALQRNGGGEDGGDGLCHSP